VQLGLENKKKTMWAAALGAVAIFFLAYRVVFPMLSSPSSADSSAQAAAPAAPPASSHTATKLAKKPRVESLDPTLRLDLLAASEQTEYQGNGRNIFISQVEIPKALFPAATDHKKNDAAVAQDQYVTPAIPSPPPIPLQFYGFASQPGEPKKIFLKKGEDMWVAGEGDTVDRRYKVVRITPTTVEIQDVLYSNKPQSLPLTQG